MTDSTVIRSDGVSRYPTISVQTYELLSNPSDGCIGVKIVTHGGDVAIIPILYPWAKDFAEDLLAALYREAPEIFDYLRPV